MMSIDYSQSLQIIDTFYRSWIKRHRQTESLRNLARMAAAACHVTSNCLCQCWESIEKYNIIEYKWQTSADYPSPFHSQMHSVAFINFHSDSIFYLDIFFSIHGLAPIL